MIHSEVKSDIKAIRKINVAAFNRDSEADLVDYLRETPEFNSELSLVAVNDKEIVGYLLLYPVDIKTEDKVRTELGLGPIAVKPRVQGKGFGSALIKEGIKRAKKLGYKVIVVLGDPDYYSKFGFVLAKTKGLKIALDVPQDHFIVLELEENCLGEKGEVYYNEEFSKV